MNLLNVNDDNKEMKIEKFFELVGNKLTNEVKSFLMTYPQYFYYYSQYTSKKNYPSPESWEKINNYILNLYKIKKINLKKIDIDFKNILGENIGEFLLDFIRTIKLRYEIEKLIIFNYQSIIPLNSKIFKEILKIRKRGFVYNLRNNSFIGDLKRKYYQILLNLNITTIEKNRKNKD